MTTDDPQDYPPSKISFEDTRTIMRELVPVAGKVGIECIELKGGFNRVRFPYSDDWVRPGGTVSGPAMMMVADLGLYLGVLSLVGFEPMAVTSNLSINFLARPKPEDFIAETRMIKTGKRLSYGEVQFYSISTPDVPIAHANGTYAMPP